MAGLLEDGYLGGLSRGQPAYFVSQYLDSPILVTVREQFEAACSFWSTRSLAWNTLESKRLLKTCNTHERNLYNFSQFTDAFSTYTSLGPKSYKEIYHIIPLGYEKAQWLERALDLSTEIYNDSITGIDKWIQGPSPPVITHTERLPAQCMAAMNEEVYWYSRWYFWDTIVQSVSEKMSQGKRFCIHVDLGHRSSCITDANWVLLEVNVDSNKRDKHFLSWDQLLMIKDVCYVRAQVYTSVRVFYDRRSDLTSAITRVIRWHEECLVRYGNAGFDILSKSEALSKAYLSLCSGDEFGSEGPFGRMELKVLGKEISLRAANDSREPLALQFRSILESVNSPQLVTEIFGLQKISGHPMVDPRKGLTAVAAASRTPSEATYSDCQELAWNFSRMFLETYVRKRGWPILTFSKGGTRLETLYSLQKKHLHRWSYPLSDWAHCRFERIFEFDYSPNYLELMDDKAISQYRDNIASNWYSDVEARSHRRLILELLSREDVDPREVIEAIMRRDVPYLWKIVCLYPKEREFKLNPRMFAMMVFEMRLAWTLLEDNIAKDILPFFPQLTMVDDRLEITKTFLDMTKPRPSDTTRTIFFENDLTTWCQLWRKSTVNPVAMVVEDMYGMPGAYTYIHDFFFESMMVCRVRDLPPEGIKWQIPPESELLYYHDQGGKEGIQQKLWSLCTGSMIDLALKDLPIAYKLVGQGDNQVVATQTQIRASEPVRPQLVAFRQLVLPRIQVQCKKVNQIMKPEECLDSSTFITYSKDVYV